MSNTRGAAGPAFVAPRALTVDEVIQRADALDARRRLQVAEQRKVIDRVLKGETLTTEFLRQQDELVEAKARIDAALDMLNNGSRRLPPGSIAFRVLAILDPHEPRLVL